MNSNLSLPQIIRSIGTVLLALTMLSASPIVSSSMPPAVTPFCACCVESGVWSLETHKIEDYQLEELNRLTLDGAADFYGTEAWPNDVSGVSAPDDDLAQELVISIVREHRDWKFFFKTSKGEKGALILTIPVVATFFKADIEDVPKSDRSYLRLYKEIRLEGDVRGTGIFAKGMAPKTRYRLVLQGGGNGCMRAEDFYRWNLRVSGPQAGYTIYGFFSEPTPSINR
jgi:hypothetical protein